MPTSQGNTDKIIVRLNHHFPSPDQKRRCEITIISFSRSICCGGLADLIGVTGNLIPAVFHAIVTLSAPFGHLPLEGKAAIREYHLLKKGGEAATRALNLEP